VIIPPVGYLKAARDICKKNNVVLILDEIQTGLGRTGKMLAEEHDGIEADLTLIGKALSGFRCIIQQRSNGCTAAR